MLISNIITAVANNYFSDLDLDIIVSHMADTSSHGSTSAPQPADITTTRTVKDVYSHGSWPDTVRTIFIYGDWCVTICSKKNCHRKNSSDGKYNCNRLWCSNS